MFTHLLSAETTWLGDLMAWVQGRIQTLVTNEDAAYYLTLGVIAAFVILLCSGVFIISSRMITRSMGYVVKKSRSTWDDLLLKHRFFTRLALLAPALVVYLITYAWPDPDTAQAIQRGITAYMLFAGILVVAALLNAVEAIYRTTETSRSRPIKGFVEIVKILVSMVGAILILSVLMDKSPWVFLSGLGAITAVLLIVFKDSLLGLVASFQIATTGMVREGDWIGMPKFGADGDVIDVSLHTVKVRNWDKTITTIPTYALVSESFKNWRGMEESGGRRIKRSINIDVSSIRFLDEEQMNRLEKIHYLGDYIRERRKDVETWNEEHHADLSEIVNGRRLTNVGTFRAYIEAYLSNHPDVNRNMTFLIRQLQPTEHGLPIQIYIFSKVQAWVAYEKIQADIFDHILAVASEFDLRIFQSPSGADFQKLPVR